jgi:transposase-like protein
MPKRNRAPRRPWTAEDKAELARLVKEYGTNWPRISKLIHRSESTTRNTWHDRVKPNARLVNRTKLAQKRAGVQTKTGPAPKTQPRIIKPDDLFAKAARRALTGNRSPEESNLPSTASEGEPVQPVEPSPTAPTEMGVADAGVYPTDHQLFDVLRNSPKTLAELSRIFDRSSESILKRLDTLEVEGWHLVREEDQFSVPVSLRPQVETPVPTIADLAGRDIRLGISSDLHAGSRWSQPTAYNRFRKIAYEEYGVRVFLEPGDKTAGIYGYKGQDQDLMPECRPISRQESYGATFNQVLLANQ